MKISELDLRFRSNEITDVSGCNYDEIYTNLKNGQFFTLDDLEPDFSHYYDTTFHEKYTTFEEYYETASWGDDDLADKFRGSVAFREHFNFPVPRFS